MFSQILIGDMVGGIPGLGGKKGKKKGGKRRRGQDVTFVVDQHHCRRMNIFVVLLLTHNVYIDYVI